jgi:hypothetical protein
MPETSGMSEGYQKLIEILSDAVAGGADSVSLEWEGGGGLEVMFNSGNTGAGFLLDSELGQEVIDSLYEEKKKNRGKLRLSLHGEDYIIQVKTYENFGENAYQLTFRQAKR